MEIRALELLLRLRWAIRSGALDLPRPAGRDLRRPQSTLFQISEFPSQFWARAVLQIAKVEWIRPPRAPLLFLMDRYLHSHRRRTDRQTLAHRFVQVQ